MRVAERPFRAKSDKSSRPVVYLKAFFFGDIFQSGFLKTSSEILRKEKVWHREIIVSGTLSNSVVLR